MASAALTQSEKQSQWAKPRGIRLSMGSVVERAMKMNGLELPARASPAPRGKLSFIQSQSPDKEPAR